MAGENGRTVKPQVFRSPVRCVEPLYGFRIVCPNLGQVGQAIFVKNGLDITGLVQVFSLVELLGAVGGTGNGYQVAAGTAAPQTYMFAVHIVLGSVGPKETDRRLHIFQGLGHLGRRGHPVVDAGHHVAVFGQFHPAAEHIILVGVDKAAPGDKNNCRQGRFGVLGPNDIHSKGYVLVAPAGHLGVNHPGGIGHFRFAQLQIDPAAAAFVGSWGNFPLGNIFFDSCHDSLLTLDSGFTGGRSHRGSRCRIGSGRQRRQAGAQG